MEGQKNKLSLGYIFRAAQLSPSSPSMPISYLLGQRENKRFLPGKSQRGSKWLAREDIKQRGREGQHNKNAPFPVSSREEKKKKNNKTRSRCKIRTDRPINCPHAPIGPFWDSEPASVDRCTPSLWMQNVIERMHGGVTPTLII